LSNDVLIQATVSTEKGKGELQNYESIITSHTSGKEKKRKTRKRGGEEPMTKS